MQKNLVSLAAIVASITAGVLVTLAVSTDGAEVGGVAVFSLCAAIAYGLNWLVFVPSWQAHTEKYFDLTGSLTYLTVTVFALVATGADSGRSIVVAVLIVIWATRLGSFLFQRVRRDGRDGRFDELKVDFGQFLMTWTLQGLWVLLTVAAGLAAITAAEDPGVDAWLIVGAIVWMVGFGIEAVADQQKKAFRSDPANKGAFITVGLWAWSRHPNYFGEILLWTGIALISVPTLSGWRYAALISPVFVYVLLTRISGLPLLESRASKKWGTDPAYREYKNATPALLLRPPSR